MWVTKLLISQVKKKDFLPQNDQIWPKIGIFGQFGPGHAGFFGALLVGRLVVVARGLYLARHLFTLLFSICSPNSKGLWYVRKIVRLEEIYLHNQENSRGLIIGKVTLVWL